MSGIGDYFRVDDNPDNERYFDAQAEAEDALKREADDIDDASDGKHQAIAAWIREATAEPLSEAELDVALDAIEQGDRSGARRFQRLLRRAVDACEALVPRSDVEQYLSR